MGRLDLTLSMLTPAAEPKLLVTALGKNAFGQVSDATARHGVLEASHPPLPRFGVDASKSFFVLARGMLELAPRREVAIHPRDARRVGVETGTPAAWRRVEESLPATPMSLRQCAPARPSFRS